RNREDVPDHGHVETDALGRIPRRRASYTSNPEGIRCLLGILRKKHTTTRQIPRLRKLSPVSCLYRRVPELRQKGERRNRCRDRRYEAPRRAKPLARQDSKRKNPDPRSRRNQCIRKDQRGHTPTVDKGQPQRWSDTRNASRCRGRLDKTRGLARLESGRSSRLDGERSHHETQSLSYA